MIALQNIWALALLPLPIAVWFLAKALPAKGAVLAPESVIAQFRDLAGKGGVDRLSRPIDLALRALVWVALVIALAGPFEAKAPLLAPSGRDLMIALDLSASMGEADMGEDANDRGDTRIDVIRGRLGPFIEGRAGDRVALMGFGTEAYIIAPFTFDVGAIAAMLEEATIGLPGRRTDLGQAIGLAVQSLRKTPDAERALILISDGETNVGDLAARDAAALAAEIGLKVYVIGYAREIDSDSENHMREIAEMTGGAFFAATAPDLMDDIYAEIDRLAPATAEESGAAPVQDHRWAPLLLAFLGVLVSGWREFRDP